MAPVPVSARLLLLLLPVAATLGEPAAGAGCDPGVSISGGTVSLSHGGAVGSVLSYACPPGHYPYPTSSRSCLSTGDWSPIGDSRRQPIHNAICREFRCPAPSVEQGTVSPRGAQHRPGDTVSFVCHDGYRLLGSARRTCMSNGRWNGSTAVCDDGADTCPNPGTPPGSVKSGHNYGVDDKVRYRCLSQLALIGSTLRVCQETGGWTGSEPSCQHKSSLDLPEEVALHFSSSFSHVLGETKVNDKEVEEDKMGRAINVRRDQKLHIYILLDVSGSVSEPDFEKSKDALSKFINMISRFEVSARYGVLLFASQTEVIVSISGELADNAYAVAERVSGLKYSNAVGRGAKGTNITGALQTVHWAMSYFRTSMRDKQSEWEEIRHVIMIFTDGKANVGGPPAPMIKRISSFLEVDKFRISYLDIYVFAIGSEINFDEINSMASQKTNEKHVFRLSRDDIHKVFTEMLDLSTVDNLCGFANQSLNATEQSAYPWLVEIVNSRKPDGHCSGSVVSPEWILTAAHCFGTPTTADISVFKVGLGGKDNMLVEVERLVVHPLYNLRAKEGDKIREFYDYDVALIKLATSLNFTTNIRPICLPCTAETSVALRKPRLGTSCKDHETALLLSNRLVQAKFVRKNHGLQNLESVKIKTGDAERGECIEHALQADIYVNVSAVGDVVTDRFLCTGGNDEKVSCKGDSGGPLYIKEVYRNIQVGVVSWGVKDVCGGSRDEDHARDFHLNLFRVLDWLREHLGGSIHFL